MSVKTVSPGCTIAPFSRERVRIKPSLGAIKLVSASLRSIWMMSADSWVRSCAGRRRCLRSAGRFPPVAAIGGHTWHPPRPRPVPLRT